MIILVSDVSFNGVPLFLGKNPGKEDDFRGLCLGVLVSTTKTTNLEVGWVGVGIMRTCMIRSQDDSISPEIGFGVCFIPRLHGTHVQMPGSVPTSGTGDPAIGIPPVVRSSVEAPQPVTSISGGENPIGRVIGSIPGKRVNGIPWIPKGAVEFMGGVQTVITIEIDGGFAVRSSGDEGWVSTESRSIPIVSGFILPTGDDISIHKAIRSSITIDIRRIQPEGNVGNGILVQPGRFPWKRCEINRTFPITAYRVPGFQTGDVDRWCGDALLFPTEEPWITRAKRNGLIPSRGGIAAVIVPPVNKDLGRSPTCGEQASVKADTLGSQVGSHKIFRKHRFEWLRKRGEALGQTPGSPRRIDRTETVKVRLVEKESIQVETEDLLTTGPQILVQVPAIHIIGSIRRSIEKCHGWVFTTSGFHFPIHPGCRGQNICCRQSFDQRRRRRNRNGQFLAACSRSVCHSKRHNISSPSSGCARNRRT